MGQRFFQVANSIASEKGYKLEIVDYPVIPKMVRNMDPITGQVTYREEIDENRFEARASCMMDIPEIEERINKVKYDINKGNGKIGIDGKSVPDVVNKFLNKGNDSHSNFSAFSNDEDARICILRNKKGPLSTVFSCSNNIIGKYDIHIRHPGIFEAMQEHDFILSLFRFDEEEAILNMQQLIEYIG